MRYQSTTGLHATTSSSCARESTLVLTGRNINLKGHRMGLYRQVEITLVLLRQNMSQTVVADLFGISQPSVSRIYRRILGLLEVVTMFTGTGLEQSLAQGHLVLMDAGLRPYWQPARHRPGQGQRRRQAPQRRRQAPPRCLSVQMACTSRGDLIAVWRPGPGSTTRQRSPRAVPMARGLGQLSRAVDR